MVISSLLQLISLRTVLLGMPAFIVFARISRVTIGFAIALFISVIYKL